MPLAEHWQLLEWTDRQLTPRKRGAIPCSSLPILELLDLPLEFELQVEEQYEILQ